MGILGLRFFLVDIAVDELIARELGPTKFMEGCTDLLPEMVERYKHGL